MTKGAVEMACRKASVLCWCQPKVGTTQSVWEYSSVMECLPSIHETLGSARYGERGLERVSLSDLKQENASTVKELRG